MPDLEQLCARFQELKAWEAEAKAARLKAEEAILEAVDADKVDEGTVSTQVGKYKLSCVYKMNRKVDEEALAGIVDRVPPALLPIRTKHEVDTRKYRYLENNEPEIYKLVATVVEAKPAKTYIKIEEDDSVSETR